MGIWLAQKRVLCYRKITSQRPLKPAANIATIKIHTPARFWASHYNKTTIPRIPITAAATATPAGFSAPLLVLRVDVGGVTDFVGEPDAVVIGAIAVLCADRVGAVPLPDACDAVLFAEVITKPELAVALGADVGAAVVLFEEVAAGAA